MTDDLQKNDTDHEFGEDFSEEGAPAESHGAIPRFLLVTYWILPIWGVLWFFVYMGGFDGGFLDREAWGNLQRSALTTWDTSRDGVEEVPASDTN